MGVVKYQKEIFAIMILFVAVIALYYTFAPIKCADFSCFTAHMAKCKSATYVNEEVEAAWNYRIIGTSEKKCDIEVILLIAKESNLDLRQYEGNSMICSHSIGTSGYPEKNLALCKGELKENLQSIVIERLYKYIVTNIGEIREEILSY